MRRLQATDEAGFPGFDKAIRINRGATYTGCDQEAFVITFQYNFTLPCKFPVGPHAMQGCVRGVIELEGKGSS